MFPATWPGPRSCCGPSTGAQPPPQGRPGRPGCPTRPRGSRGLARRGEGWRGGRQAGPSRSGKAPKQRLAQLPVVSRSGHRHDQVLECRPCPASFDLSFFLPPSVATLGDGALTHEIWGDANPELMTQRLSGEGPCLGVLVTANKESDVSCSQRRSQLRAGHRKRLRGLCRPWRFIRWWRGWVPPRTPTQVLTGEENVPPG